MATLSPCIGPLASVDSAALQIYTLDPLSDSRWDDLVRCHPRASVFHRTGWLRALARTYGYEPIVLTSALPGERLTDGMVFCGVKSWITGSRLVSLPFSDHCEPLLNGAAGSMEFINWMRAECGPRRWKYVELRPLTWASQSDGALVASQSYWFHVLDLRRSLEEILRNLHKNSVQRRIQRAQREQLSYEIGCSDRLLDDFYRLLLITRRRHRALPQPRAWFQNLITCMGQDVQIRVARKEGIAVAAILTLRHGTTVVYKYGCSDHSFHYLAAMPFLFWKLIAESKAAGAAQIDLGRTDLENKGLATFKDRFGATRKRLTYLRYPETAGHSSFIAAKLPALRRLFTLVPDVLLPWAGQLVYRHIG
jgi:CelD/BcsL family acetyltransferase involved in cellulose biosynthesis